MEISNYLETVKTFSSADALPESLLISEGPKGLSTYYAPFEHINQNAKLVICGITPGLQQANTALSAASSSLNSQNSIEDSLKIAKNTGSFAGAMRTNLIAMLNYIGMADVLDINDCSDLFSSRNNLVHYTSALRNPVMKNGKNYSGDSAMVNEPYLWNQIETQLTDEIQSLDDAIWLPLGKSVVTVFEKLVDDGFINSNRVLFGMPHASGANAERIKYFLGKKKVDDLSTKVNPRKIDQAKKDLLAKIQNM